MRSFLMVLAILSFPAAAQDYDDDAEPIEVERVPSAQSFDQELSPYGEWVWLNDVRVFRPSVRVVGPDFVPYASHGQWVSTEAGWSFSSSLPFGWATFHYGRWWFDEREGWVWMPDTVWGPAWVDWRFGGGYAGWAPLPPPVFIRFHRPRWFFVQAPYFASQQVVQYSVPPSRFDVAFHASVPVATRQWRGSTWYAGPAYRDVVHVAVATPQRRSMSAFVPPPEFHRTISAPGYVPPPPLAPPRGNVGPPPRGPGFGAPPPPPRGNAGPPPRGPGFGAPPPPQNNFAPAPRGSNFGAPPPPPRGQNFGAPPPQNNFAPAPRGPNFGAPPPPPQNNFAPPPRGPSVNAPPPPPPGNFAPPPQRMNAPPGGGFAPPPPAGAPPPPQRRNAGGAPPPPPPPRR